VKHANRDILEGLREGDPEAFRTLYDSYFRRVHGYVLRKLGDPAEAEDVTQEVFEAVLTGIDRFEGRSQLGVWIYGIARNLMNNRLRRRGGVRLVSLDELPMSARPVEPGPEKRAEARESLNRMHAAIARLPAEQRRIFELRHERRLAIRKIAALLRRSEDAVKSSLYRSRRALLAEMPDAGASPLL